MLACLKEEEGETARNRDEMDFQDKDGLASAQLRSTLHNITLTLLANVAIAFSALLILRMPDNALSADDRQLALFWFFGVMTLAGLRFWGSRLIAKGRLLASEPRKALWFLAGLAFLSGLSWCPIPLYFAAISSSEVQAYIIFVTGGIVTGAVIQSLAYWPIAVAFGTPLMLATILCLFLFSQRGATVIAADVLLLTIMLFRAAVFGERNFARSHRIASEATTLAASLGKANEKIMNANLALEQLANTDPLTGLGNRMRFNAAMARICNGTDPAALLLFDLDSFKTLNDTLGHAAGDFGLKRVAECLLETCDDKALPVRLGGDEFAILVTDNDPEQAALRLAERFSSSIRKAVYFESHPLLLGASVGIAIFEPRHPASAERLYAEADAALYLAKQAGRGCVRVFGREKIGV